MKKLLHVFCLSALLFLLSCSKSSSNNNGGNNNNNPGGNTSGSTVTINGSSFSPATLTVKTGTTVTWKNDDNMTHTATADNGSFNTGDIAAGASKSLTMSAVGNFPYHCNWHSGMTGTIVVTN